METTRTNHGGLAVVAPPSVGLKRLDDRCEAVVAWAALCSRRVRVIFVRRRSHLPATSKKLRRTRPRWVGSSWNWRTCWIVSLRSSTRCILSETSTFIWSATTSPCLDSSLSCSVPTASPAVFRRRHTTVAGCWMWWHPGRIRLRWLTSWISVFPITACFVGRHRSFVSLRCTRQYLAVLGASLTWGRFWILDHRSDGLPPILRRQGSWGACIHCRCPVADVQNPGCSFTHFELLTVEDCYSCSTGQAVLERSDYDSLREGSPPCFGAVLHWTVEQVVDHRIGSFVVQGGIRNTASEEGRLEFCRCQFLPVNLQSVSDVKAIRAFGCEAAGGLSNGIRPASETAVGPPCLSLDIN